jgi:hypothetical protein
MVKRIHRDELQGKINGNSWPLRLLNLNNPVKIRLAFDDWFED